MRSFDGSEVYEYVMEAGNLHEPSNSNILLIRVIPFSIVLVACSLLLARRMLLCSVSYTHPLLSPPVTLISVQHKATLSRLNPYYRHYEKK